MMTYCEHVDDDCVMIENEGILELLKVLMTEPWKRRTFRTFETFDDWTVRAKDF